MAHKRNLAVLLTQHPKLRNTLRTDDEQINFWMRSGNSVYLQAFLDMVNAETPEAEKKALKAMGNSARSRATDRDLQSRMGLRR